MCYFALNFVRTLNAQQHVFSSRLLRRTAADAGSDGSLILFLRKLQVFLKEQQTKQSRILEILRKDNETQSGDEASQYAAVIQSEHTSSTMSLYPADLPSRILLLLSTFCTHRRINPTYNRLTIITRYYFS